MIDGLTKEEMQKWEKEGKALRLKAGWKLEEEEGEGTVVSDLFWKVSWTTFLSLGREESGREVMLAGIGADGVDVLVAHAHTRERSVIWSCPS